MRRVLGIWDANALGPNLCLLGSLFNHPCTPNAYTTFNEALGEQTFHATRDIRSREEICISYLDGPSLLLPYDQR